MPSWTSIHSQKIKFFVRYCSLKNPVFWFVLRFPDHNSRTRFFAIMLFLQKVKKTTKEQTQWNIGIFILKKKSTSKWIRFYVDVDDIDFQFQYCSMLIHSCNTLGGIICTTRLDTSFIFLACLMSIVWFAAMCPASLEKHQLGAKATKMTTPALIIAAQLLYCSVQAEYFYSLAVQRNK